MSHIPASAMPHATTHDENKDAASPTSTDNGGGEQGGSAATVTEQAQQAASSAAEAIKSAASSASEAASDAASATGDAAAKAATATSGAAKGTFDRVNALPTYAKLLGVAALVGGVAAAVAVPLLNQPEETGRAKRKKAKKKA